MRRRGALAGAALVALGLCAGCQGDHARSEPAPPLVVPTTRSTPEGGLPAPMQVSVADVRATPNIDPQAIRSALESAEPALLTCVDASGSTGILVLSFPVERDGSVGDIVEGSRTTYGSEAARICVEKIVATMRFPREPHDTGRADVTVTLEVSPRR